MELEYLPLLQKQRELYDLPRGPERFREYLRLMVDAESGDIALPLPALNPMGKEHLARFLDALIAFDADGEAAAALEAAVASVAAVPGEFRGCLVVCDDLHGGWTNRTAAEMSHRFGETPLYERGWIVGLLWTSEAYTPGAVRREALAALHRAAHVARHGPARTLGEMMAQEGEAMARAGWTAPVLEPDDLAYTRVVLEPELAKSDRPTVVAALFGDAAARELGYAPLGLSPQAGLALALHDARSRGPG